MTATKAIGHLRFVKGKALLCVDSEGIAISERQSAIDSVASSVGPRLRGLAVHGVVVDRSLEGWILCDRQAVANYLGLSLRSLKYQNPEEMADPVKAMRGLFRITSREDYSKTHDLPLLAEMVDPASIAESSPTFQRFRQVLTA